MDIVAIVLATLFQYVFGMLWYSRTLLGLLWASYMEEDGVSEIGLKRFNPMRAKSHATALLTALAIAIVLQSLVVALSINTLRPALIWSLGIWASMLALPTLTEYRYSKRSLVLWAIDQSYYVCAIAGTALIIVLL
ncbi:MAG: DUF1761 domain-containing protein [Patescibacteria group bacterium]